jgi:hypothetical protein
VDFPSNAQRLIVTLKHTPHGSHQDVSVTLLLNRKVISHHKASTEGIFTLTVNVAKQRGQRSQLELRSSPFFIPRLLHNTPDDRRLSLQLIDTQIEAAVDPSS